MNRFGFTLEKAPAAGSRGMVVTNHPLASGAGAGLLLAGGNAVDAAIAALFALSVVEPMMVGPLGGGLAHLRLPDGRHVIVDGLSTAPEAARPDMYRPISDRLPDRLETEGRANRLGTAAVAVPGALLAWCQTLERYGTVSLEDALRPAIALAESGFVVTPYLHTCVRDNAATLAADPDLARLLVPDGAAVPAGTRLRRPDLADTLRLIARTGPDALYHGPIGAALVERLAPHMTAADLAGYRTIEREPIRTAYRGWEILGAPPPASSGVHMATMLGMLEAFDVGAIGFGSVAGVHLLAETLKAAFADRAAVTGDPAFTPVPVDTLTDPAYAARRRALFDPAAARDWAPGVSRSVRESADTTHLTVADKDGTVVSTTQTINGLFGAQVSVPGTGLICNNYMLNFDPHPGNALSVAPGKRVFTSMAPTIALRDGQFRFALGLPGALRIFPSALQAVLNLIDHGMSLQEAVEAPRMWTQGHVLEVEEALFEAVAPGLRALGHDVVASPRIAGGMNAIARAPDGTLTGAACWRADGTPVAIAGGLARPGVRFVI